MKNYLRILAVLAVAVPVASATTVRFSFGDNPNQYYGPEDVGPYPGVLQSSTATSFFCLDLQLDSTFNTNYDGMISHPSSAVDQEAAFLAAYALWAAQKNSYTDIVSQLYGPTSFAIWQLTGSLGTDAPDPAAQAFITMAQNAYTRGFITADFLNSVDIFSPTDTSVQRFVSATYDNAHVSAIVNELSGATAPEPASLLLLGPCLLLVARRFRR